VHHYRGEQVFLETASVLTPGDPVFIGVQPSLSPDLWDEYGDHVRLRPPHPHRVELLPGDCLTCPCGLALVCVLHLDFALPRYVELHHVELRDALSPDATDVDHVDLAWVEDLGDDGLLAALDRPQRRARVQAALRTFVQGRTAREDRLRIEVPLTCAGCGQVRASTLELEAPWLLCGRSGTVRPGEHHPDDGAWHADGDQGAWLRTRPPVGPDELVLLFEPKLRFHCACASEPQWVRLLWVARPGWIALATAELVPAPDREALAAVDLVHPLGSRAFLATLKRRW
jgi:hypothetical protein